MSYAYFPGCSLRSTGVAYEESMLTLFRLLDLRLEEIPDWNCCGATSYMSIDERASYLLSARNLALAHAAGEREVVAPCSACYLVLRKTQDAVAHYPQVCERMEASLGAGTTATISQVRVRHPLDVLYRDVGPDRIRARTVRTWRGGPVACYYGCQVVRPFPEADRAHDPVHMDELLRAAGIPTVAYGLKTKCCGGTLTGTMHEVGLRLNYILLKEAARKGARSLATLCPLCQYNLDAYQREIRRDTGEPIDMPVLYFTQVLGWMLGANARELGLQRSIAGRKLVEQWFASEPVEAEVYV
jgi:heterodisulfide reductase subunit B2